MRRVLWYFLPAQKVHKQILVRLREQLQNSTEKYIARCQHFKVENSNRILEILRYSFEILPYAQDDTAKNDTARRGLSPPITGRVRVGLQGVALWGLMVHNLCYLLALFVGNVGQGGL